LQEKTAKALKNSSSSSSSGGFKMFHLLAITLLGMLIGAYYQIHFAAPNVVVNVDSVVEEPKIQEVVVEETVVDAPIDEAGPQNLEEFKYMVKETEGRDAT
jgi:hypothetical protein